MTHTLTGRPVRTLAALSLGLLIVAAGCDTVVTTRPGELSGPLGGEATGRVDLQNDAVDGGTMKTTSADVVAMTEQMIRSILAEPTLADAADPPRIICDSEYFKNLSNDPTINTRLLTTRIRSKLNHYANGRMTFVARHGGATRILDEESMVRGEPQHFTADAHYRLLGEINNHTIAGRSQFMQFNFEIIDTRTGEIVWSDFYEFKKAGRQPIGYDR